ncbi:5'-deoxynucleotidase [Desulfuribacillus alkaliarsenatis]|uniref:5'-deoxynucleotidase n=1 Tax=Desulfuribacillus alkaliarsenatis TaxID=766136 RepID=A0A1E5G0T1_9FIRM|nr:5'-deoxynucleotidase [Desulfuribacillus alkaliarsenatis]OEF96517.1 5'-deoxynucleotidase [Desulfuribacillus alkaliarsenatis]
MSHFFAYLARMKLIKRWGLMRNTHPENIQEHSLQVAMVAHSLAVIKNKRFAGQLNPERVATLAIFHDISEVITGDLATPIKYFNPQIKKAYKDIEQVANEKLYKMLPEELQDEYSGYIFEAIEDKEHWLIIKAADKICAYLKCLEELKAGNEEFSQAAKAIRAEIEANSLPEVKYFVDTFVKSFTLTLDELN